MDINITGRHLELKNGVKELTREKFGNIDRFFHGISSVDIVFKQDDRKIHCEVILHVNKHGTIVVDVARDDFGEAIDIAVDKCERQLRRLKEKIKDHRGSRSTTPVTAEVSETEEEE